MKFKFLLAFSFLANIQTVFAADWRTADRSSAGIAPLPSAESRAVVQAYAARLVDWRGRFAVHTWIATKEANATDWRTYHVIGWRLYRGLGVVRIENTIEPDARWFGNVPELLADIRGAQAESAIPKIHAAANSYPYPHEYRAWPGPNSNTFVSYIIRRVPELQMKLPPHAIGKDWIEDGKFYGKSEEKTGFQVSIFGLLGMTLGLREGFEMNILGLSFGFDVMRPALKLPMVGRIGMSDRVVVDSDSSEIKPPEIPPAAVGNG